MDLQRLRWVAIPAIAVAVLVHALIANAYQEWVVGPATVIIIFLATASTDSRRAREVRLWEKRQSRRLRRSAKVVDERAGSYRDKPEGRAPDAKVRVKKIATLPPELALAGQEAGLGTPIAHYELVPQIAFLSIVGASARESSDHQSVVVKLDKTAPTFTVRPLPIVDGARVPNPGIAFKHAEFMDKFVVEGLNRDAIRKWLTKPLRDVLCGMQDVWLHVNRRAIAVTLYGSADVDAIDDLIGVADVFCAEYGADGGPSLFGDDGDDDDEESAVAAPAKKKKKKPAKSA